MCTDQHGWPWLACQSWNERGQARIAVFRLRQPEQWQEVPGLPKRGPGDNCWSAALAAGPGNQVAIAYDVYRDGDYDAVLNIIDGDKVTEHMGTDWRDNDKDVEPIVEIYQGDRNSYEIEGAPRAGYEAKSGKEPVNIGGWYPKGFINLALDKGYRLGLQAPSDRHSTHISFCVVLAGKKV